MSGKITEMTLVQLLSGTSAYAALAYGGQNYRADISMAPLGVASRTALAAIASPTSGTARLLLEAGREGVFVFTSSSVSTFVAADTAQGVYIAPATDTTGASGAWVRKFSGPMDVRWFGAVADDPGTGGFGTDAYPAIAATFALAQANAHAGYENPTFYRGGTSVLIPRGGYYCSQSLAPLFTGIILGEGGKGWGAATRIRFAAGVDGLQLQAHNTSGKTTLDGATHFAGDRLYISDIAFIGAYSGTEGDTHGVRGKRAATIERCTFDNFEGDGLYCHTEFGSGVGSTEGNTNIMRVIDCDFQNCRNGRSMKEADANAITFIGCNYSNNRMAGIDEQSFLGNHEFGPHLDGNARTPDNTGTAAKPASYTSTGGYRYFVIRGNESGAATNAPVSSTVTITIASPGVVSWTAHGLANGTQVAFSTTGALPTGLSQNTAYYVVNAGANNFQVAATLGGAAINTSGSQNGTHTAGAGKDNTWWGYWEAGAASSSTGVIAWQSGLTWRAGGPVLHDNLNNSSTIHGCHIESNGISQVNYGLIIQGTHYLVHRVIAGALVRNRSSTITSSSSGLVLGNTVRVMGGLYSEEPVNHLGPTTGAVISDGETRFASRSTQHFLTFNVYSASGAITSTPLQIIAGSGFGVTYDIASAGHFQRFRVGGNERFKIDDSGAIIATAKALFVGSNAVVKDRKTGWTVDTGTAKRTANATYTPGSALTFGAAYVEAELDAAATRIAAIEDALRDATQTIKALKDDLHATAGHGLIGT